MDKNCAIILAGGLGTRFWPKSKIKKPKQFLDILGTGKTLLQSTFNRLNKVVEINNIYIITTEEYIDIIKEQIPNISMDNILVEPERKNTAPCILYSCFKIGKKNPNANILIAPADHLILDEECFKTTMLKCFDFASKNDNLLTIGIKPLYPSTGYGYIQYVENNEDFKNVKTFTEKPNEEIATTFIKSGDFLWNAGMFIWNFQIFSKTVKKVIPESYDLFDLIIKDLNTPNESKAIKNLYSLHTNISIDYALLEKSDNVVVIPAEFEWSDLGTWKSVYEAKEKDYLGNAVNGKYVKIYDSSNNLIIANDKKLVIVEGIKNMAIVDTEDTLMIIPIEKEQKVKNYTGDLKLEKLDKFL